MRPHVVYAPSRVDVHCEHQRVAQALAKALVTQPTKEKDPIVRIFQVQVPLGAVLVNRIVDIASVEAAHRAALTAHVSPGGSILRSLRLKRYAGHAHRLPGLAEEFWELPAAAYSALHRGSPGEWRERHRGCRFLSVTDPAAYLIGRAARRDLCAAAGR